MKNRCVVVAGGESNLETLSFISENDFIIAADSGFKILQKGGIVPDLVVGDFDSYSAEIPNGIEVIRLPCVKDDTDLLFALKMGTEKGFKDFVILGGYGSRPDHNFAMYQSMLWVLNNNHDAKINALCDGFSVTVLSNSSLEILVFDDEYLSVFAFGGAAESVSVKNADYVLNEQLLTPDFPLGVSNCVTGGGKVQISVKKGNLLIFKVKKDI